LSSKLKAEGSKVGEAQSSKLKDRSSKREAESSKGEGREEGSKLKA
jgi:hypothetical protein